MSDKFVYVTYINTTREKLWDALTQPEFQRVYWFGTVLESSWKQGAPWKMVSASGTVSDTGEILEAERPSRLVIKWRNEFRPELKAEGYSRCTFEIEASGAATKLTVRHEIDATASKFIEAVSGGWPRILSNLKSLLETGKIVEAGAPAPKA